MKSLLNKRIAIFGAGAIGSYIGSKFIEHGFTNVEFVARSGYNVLSHIYNICNDFFWHNKSRNNIRVFHSILDRYNKAIIIFRKTFFKMSSFDDAISLTKSLFKEAQNAAKLCGVDIADEVI